MKDLKNLKGAKILSKKNQININGGGRDIAPLCETDLDCIYPYLWCISGFCAS